MPILAIICGVLGPVWLTETLSLLTQMLDHDYFVLLSTVLRICGLCFHRVEKLTQLYHGLESFMPAFALLPSADLPWSQQELSSCCIDCMSGSGCSDSAHGKLQQRQGSQICSVMANHSDFVSGKQLQY